MSACRSCGAAIVWAETGNGKKSPFQLDAAGIWMIGEDGIAKVATPDVTERYTSHFARCPHAGQWRAKQTKARA